MIDLEYLHVVFAVETGDGIERLPGDGLSLLPGIGDEVEMNYVNGTKVSFIVTGVKHHLSSVGDNLLQQIEVSGKKIKNA